MKKLGILSISALLMCACSSSEINELDPSNQETALLSISTSVLTQDTKAGVTRTTATGTDKALVDGVGTGPVMGAALAKGSEIGVCVYDAGGFTKYSGVSANTGFEGLSWSNTESAAKWTASAPFYLGNKPADVYAYFPKTAVLTNANDQKDENVSNDVAPTVAVTAGYTDYLYGKHTNTEANKNTVNINNRDATIKLNHALAMIYFTFKTDASFAGNNNEEDRKLTSIQLMNLPQNGTMSLNSETGATATEGDGNKFDAPVKKYTTTAYSDTYTETIPTTGSIGGSIANTNTPLLHYLVLPNSGMVSTTGDNDLYAKITIGGIIYKVPLNVKKSSTGDEVSDNNKWEAGKAYAYNLTLKSGMGTNNTLVVSSVSVTPWGEGGSSDVIL